MQNKVLPNLSKPVLSFIYFIVSAKIDAIKKL